MFCYPRKSTSLIVAETIVLTFLNISRIFFCRMLDPELKHQYELIKKAYADVLYNWNLLNKRIEVLKHTDSSSGAQTKGVG